MKNFSINALALPLTLTLPLALILILPSTSWGQGTIAWEPEITVSDGAMHGNYRPRATVVGDTPVVIYGRTGIENLFISRWDGSGFSTQPLLPSGTSSYIAGWTGPDIASIEDTVIAVFKLSPEGSGNVYVVRSTDRGQTFSDTIRVNNYTGGNSWMPSMDMTPDGNPVIAMMIHDGVWGNPRYALTHSTDGGLTFGPVNEITAGIAGEACDCCPAEVVVSGANQVLLFRNNEANIRDVYGVLSNDGGQTFPYSENIDQLSWNISACPSTGMDGVFAGDVLYSVYASAAEGIYRVYLSKADANGGLTLDTVRMMAEPIPGNGTQNYPTISAANDTIVMAWEERINFNKEIYYSVSVPGVDPMHALTTYKFQANETTTGNQTNPEIIYKNGFVHLFYQDDGSGDLIYRRGQINVDLALSEHTGNSLRLYPNPASHGEAFLEGDVQVMRVSSISGEQMVFTQTQLNLKTQIQVNGAAAGLYLVQGLDASGQPFSVRWLLR